MRDTRDREAATDQKAYAIFNKHTDYALIHHKIKMALCYWHFYEHREMNLWSLSFYKKGIKGIILPECKNSETCNMHVA